MSEISEGKSIYYIPPEEIKMFHLKWVQNVVSAIRILMNLCISVANNVVILEDIV